jgi:hypothetical protein
LLKHLKNMSERILVEDKGYAKVLVERGAE